MLIRASVRSSVATHPSAPSPTARSSGYRAVPVPHSWPRRPPSLTAPLTCVPITCVARSVAVHRPLPLDAQLTLPWPLGRTWHGALGFPQPSQGHPQSVAIVDGACVPPRAVRSHPDDRNRSAPAFPSLILQMYVFRGMVQLLHMDAAKVDQDVAHVAYFCKFFRWYVLSILKKSFICFRRMLQ